MLWPDKVKAFRGRDCFLKTSMPKQKASKRSAVTQPKFKTNEVTIKGTDVILTGDLADGSA